MQALTLVSISLAVLAKAMSAAALSIKTTAASRALLFLLINEPKCLLLFMGTPIFIFCNNASNVSA
jgi:hypothetical protein